MKKQIVLTFLVLSAIVACTKKHASAPMGPLHFVAATVTNTPTYTYTATCGPCTATPTPRPSYSGGGSSSSNTSGGGSCPLIYAFDGEQFHLEAESFEDAFCRGAERQDFDSLSKLRAVDGEYILKITNERPETHLTNQVILVVVDAPNGARIVPSLDGEFHTISHPVDPVACRDIKGVDVLDTVLSTDGLMWESDLNSKDFSLTEDLRDALILSFPKPLSATRAKFVLNASNTPLGIYAWKKLFGLKGEAMADWYQSLDDDPAELNKVQHFMNQVGALKVMVKQTDGWKVQGELTNVGPEVSKDMVAVLDLAKVSGEILDIRLESTTGLWRIDSALVDFTENSEVIVQRLSPSSAVNEAGLDVAPELINEDGSYYKTEPGQWTDLRFDAPPEQEGMQRSFVFHSTGHYYRWFDATGPEQKELFEMAISDASFATRMILPLWRSELQTGHDPVASLVHWLSAGNQ